MGGRLTVPLLFSLKEWPASSEPDALAANETHVPVPRPDVIIDFHTHILPPSFQAKRRRIARLDDTFGELFQDPRAHLATAESLVASMDDAGIDVAVVLGYGWTDPGVARESNDYLLESARAHADRIVPFCSIGPTWGEEAAREIRRCAEAGARGIGELHPDSQAFDIRDTDLMQPVMDAAIQHRMVVLTHASDPVGHGYAGKGTVTPDKLLCLAEAFPDVRFVMAHWGGGLPFYTLMPEVSKALRQTWFDSAASPFLYDKAVFRAASETAGPGRVLFGSDFPLLAQARVLGEAMSARLSKEDLDQLLGGNAAELLALEDGRASPPEHSDSSSGASRA